MLLEQNPNSNYGTSQRTINQMEAFGNQKRTMKIVRNYTKQKKKMIKYKKQDARVKVALSMKNTKVLDKEAIIKMIQSQKLQKKKLDLQNVAMQNFIDRSKRIGLNRDGDQNQVYRNMGPSDLLRDNIFLKSLRSRYEELNLKYRELLKSVQLTKKSKKYTRYQQTVVQNELCFQELKRLKAMQKMFTLAYKQNKRMEFQRIIRENDAQLLEEQIKQGVKDQNQELIERIEQLQAQLQTKKASKAILAQQRNKLIREIDEYKQKLNSSYPALYHQKYGKQFAIYDCFSYKVSPSNTNNSRKFLNEDYNKLLTLDFENKFLTEKSHSNVRQPTQQQPVSTNTWKQQLSSTTSIYQMIKGNRFSNKQINQRRSVPSMGKINIKYSNQDYEDYEDHYQGYELEEEQFEQIEEEDYKQNGINSQDEHESDEYEHFS